MFSPIHKQLISLIFNAKRYFWMFSFILNYSGMILCVGIVSRKFGTAKTGKSNTVLRKIVAYATVKTTLFLIETRK